MLEKLTILISSEIKNSFNAMHAGKIRAFRNSLVTFYLLQKDRLQNRNRKISIESAAGSYTFGKKDVLKNLFKDISK